jgi:hypothetical protein
MLIAEPFQVNERPRDRPATDLALPIVRHHAQNVELAIHPFEFCISANFRADAASGAMFDVDCCADGDLAVFAKKLQRVEAGDLHQADHVGRGIDGWEAFIVCRQRVLEIHCLVRLAARANGNLLGHDLIIKQRFSLDLHLSTSRVAGFHQAIVEARSRTCASYFRSAPLYS